MSMVYSELGAFHLSSYVELWAAAVQCLGARFQIFISAFDQGHWSDVNPDIFCVTEAAVLEHTHIHYNLHCNIFTCKQLS